MAEIIGLAGKKRSGKDTVADYLVSEYGFVRFAFADPIKEVMLAIDPIIEEPLGWSRLSELIDPDETKSIRDRFEPIKDLPEIRRFLQRHGVAVRELDENFWARSTMDKITAHRAEHPETPGYVIPDVRFVNEVAYVEDIYDGHVIRVVREGLLSDDTHVSETQLDNVEMTATLDNGGSILDLYREVDYLLETLADAYLIKPFTKIRETA